MPVAVGVASDPPDADAATSRPRRDPRRRHPDAWCSPAGAARGPGAAARLRARRHGARRSRSTARRWTLGRLGGQPASCSPTRGSRAATARLQARRGTLVLHRPRQHQREPRQRHPGRRDRARHGRPRPGGRHGPRRRDAPWLTVDGFVLTLWLVRLLFLVLLYGFLFAVARVLLRDLRAASKGPAELGRLVVLASPRAEPPLGTSFPLDAVTTLGRDVNNAIVVDDPFASAEHAVLTFRGRAWYVEDLAQHERHVRQRHARRARRGARLRRRAAGGRGPLPPRPGSRVSAVAQARPSTPVAGPPAAAPDRARACSGSSP